MTIDLQVTEEDLREHLHNYLNDFQIHTDYSGRGMMGRTCFGVTIPGDDEGLVLGWAIGKFLDDHGVDTTDVLNSTRRDNMGRSVIYYFPGFWITRDD